MRITIGESTEITRRMDLGSIGGRMGSFMKENSLMMSSKAKDLFSQEKGSRSKQKIFLSKVDPERINLKKSILYDG